MCFQVSLYYVFFFLFLSPTYILCQETIMSYGGSMFLVKQGCPYRPHYYSDNSILDQDLVEQYKDCVKTAAPSQVSHLMNDQE